MKRRYYFQKYENIQSLDNLVTRLNNEAKLPKFIDYVIYNVDKEEKKKKMIEGYKQRISKSLNPLRNIQIDSKTLQEEYKKFLTNPENAAYQRIQNVKQIQVINNAQNNNINLSKVLAIKYQLINPF